MRKVPVPVFVVSSLLFAGAGVAVHAEAAVQSPARISIGPKLKVNLTSARHAISPDIYGMNFAGTKLERELRLPVVRWGGNATTRYNYLLDTANHASDWYFENIPNAVANAKALPNGSSADRFIEQNRTDGAASLITVPLIGWTPKSRALSCGFSVKKYGKQQASDPYNPNCGNGVRSNGSFVKKNLPGDSSKRISQSFVGGWVKYLVGKYGTASSGGVRFYDLDNEPDIWFATHRDVHPVGAGYAEMLAKTESIASAIKAQDPSAQTLGPVGWGWSSLFFSGKDQQACAVKQCGSVPPDEKAHGGVPFANWYLRQLAAQAKKTGRRLLDYFDNHWYPQENGVTSNADSPSEQALRLRSTRMLWDPNYKDQSWINQPVMAIPRMKQLVAQNYPGTKVAISEYNFGALDRIDGGLAQADVLGIFGKQGLDLATLWGPPAAQQPGAFAFAMFLDYDGHGSKFGDTSVHSLSGNQGEVSVYAAQRSSDHALTIMVINKSTKPVVSPLSVAGLAGRARAQVYQYGQAKPGKIVHAAPQVFVKGHARLSLPGYSITEYVIGATGLTRGMALLPRATSTAVPGAVSVPAAHPGPVDAFSWATGYKGRKLDNGWRPAAG